MARKITEEQEKEIVAAYNKITSTKLASIYKVAPSTIRGVWQRNNCKKPPIIIDKEQFILDYQSMKIKDIAAKYKIDRHTVTKYAKKFGIYDNTPLLSEADKAEIIKGYERYTSKELADKYGCSTSWITGIWHKAGLKGKITRRYWYNEDVFEKIDTEEKAYWLGFIAADGCIHHPKDSRQDILTITLSVKDQTHLEKFQKFLETKKPISHIKQNRHEYVNLQISSNKLVKDLIDKGINFRKTYSIQSPNISDKLFRHYLRGYFDGDGSISQNFDKNTLYKVLINITGFSNNLIFFQNKLNEEGIKTILVKDNRKYNLYDNEFFGSLSFCNKTTKLQFLQYIYNDAHIYLDRKYQLGLLFQQYCSENPVTWTCKN